MTSTYSTRFQRLPFCDVPSIKAWESPEQDDKIR
jgi:hypothetical protein